MYEGSLNINKMNMVQKKAYKSWKDQRSRCNNSKDPRYYCYGAKGIKSEYSSREFITWFEKEYNKKNTWKRAQCGRIDHSKNYSFDNIELIECSDNVKERNIRCGNPEESIKIKAINVKTGEVKIFDSKRLLCREMGIQRNSLKYQLNNKLRRTPSSGWRFCNEAMVASA